MSTEISNSTGYRAGDTDDIMESGSDYFSADEEERRDRMEVEQIPAPTFGFGAPENLDASQAKFSFGVSKSTDQSQTPGSTPRAEDIELPGNEGPSSRSSKQETSSKLRKWNGEDDHPVKRQFREVNESQRLRMQLRDITAQMEVAGVRRRERLRQSQEAHRQEIASIQSQVSQQAVLTEARYTEKLRQSEQAFQLELQQKEQAMQLDLQQRSEALKQELHLAMQEKEAALKQSLEVQLASAQAQRESEIAALEQKLRVVKPKQPSNDHMLASGSASTEMPALVVSSRASTSTQTQGSTASPARTSTQTAGDTSTLASTSTQTQKTSTQSEGRQTRNPEQTVNPPTKISQTIKSLRRNHPGMSGRTMLMAASTQGNSSQSQPPPKPSAHHSNRKSREQADSSDEYDPDNEDSDNELASRLGPILMKAVRQLSKNTAIQMNANRPRRRRARVVAELQKEKDSDLREHRTEFLALVRALFKDVFEVNQDDDFALHDSVLPETARAYANDVGDGPKEADLHIDMMGGSNSMWNKKVTEILLSKLKDCREEDQWQLPYRSDAYLEELIKERLKRVMKVWAASQRRPKMLGGVESWDEVEQRLVAQKEAQLLVNRHATRRRARYARRKHIVEYLIQVKNANKSQDAHLWKWLGSVLEYLGPDGMSSDESSTEDFETVHRVKNMPWRRDVTNNMDIIDRQRHKDAEIFTAKGSKPTKRIRGTANPSSARNPVQGLPHSFYDDDWFNRQDQYHQSKLQSTDEKFDWYDIVVAT